MMANLRGVQVPYTKREWDIVTSLYRSDKVSDLKQALGLIVSWKARSGEAVHIAADMTEMLLRAIIMDKETREDDWFRMGNVQLAYCTAIIRFVNYVNEICQSGYQFKSIASAVSDVGIPEWIVVIRHGATHSHLPSLLSLREAAQYCRNWLWEHHWSRPVAEAVGMSLNMSNDSDENALQQTAVSLIDRFMLYTLEKKGDKQHMHNKLQNILTELETFIMMYPWDFLNAFLLEGYLIMDENQVKSIGCNLFAESEDIWVIPEDLQLFWKPILHFLNEANMLPQLLFQLFEALPDAGIRPFQERQLVAWIDKMLSAYTEYGGPQSAANLFAANVLTKAEWCRVLKAVMLTSEKLKEIHFDKILKKVELITGKKQASLRQLAVLSKEKPIASVVLAPDYSHSNASFKTVDDLWELMSRKENEKQPQVRNPSTVEQNNHWTACDPSEWKDIPLGLTPEQSTESLYLVIDPAMIRFQKGHRDIQDRNVN